MNEQDIMKIVVREEAERSRKLNIPYDQQKVFAHFHRLTYALQLKRDGDLAELELKAKESLKYWFE
jgi:hypothetical protein